MPRSRYKQVVDTFAARIRSGELRPGDRLPTHRHLASEHRLALATATRVYAELEAMGLVSGETGRGTFVRETSLPPGLGVDQQAAASDLVDLNFNYPSLPGQADLLRTALKRLSTSGDLDAFLRYQPHAGRLHEREIVASYLSDRGLIVEPGRLALVDGAQHGLTTTLMSLFQTGDVVAADALTYPGIKVLADSLGLELAPIKAKGPGPDMAALEELCRHRRVRAVYTQPTVHNPLGWVMDTVQRNILVEIARRHDLILIEDAPYAFLQDDAPPPIAALAPERTVYVSGFSKSVATGLRVGFLAAPEDWIPRIERAIRATTWNTPGLMTAIACGWIEDGTVSRLESAKREDAAARQDVASEVFQGMEGVSHPASYCYWLPLMEDVRADKVVRDLLDRHILVSTAEPFATMPHPPQAIRIALGSVEPDTLRRSLEVVREVIENQAYG